MKARLTQAEKNSNNKQWYKDMVNTIGSRGFTSNAFFSTNEYNSEYRRNRVNYDLYNNIIDTSDFKYVCKPYGDEVGELPATLTNRDIVSPKIKVLLGMEMSLPFSWKVVATNREATTRKEQQETQMLKDYIIQEILAPIQQEEALKAKAQTKGRPLTPEEETQVQTQIEEAVKARTPDEIQKYMTRDHQDPAEILGGQILEYLSLEQDINSKFNKGWKHMMLGGREVFLINTLNGKPTITASNALLFDHDRSPELDYIEDGEWATAEYRMTPSQILSTFGRELTNKDIDKIYDQSSSRGGLYPMDVDFSFDNNYDSTSISVRHVTFKAPMKIGFLTFIDEQGQMQEKLVSEEYKLTPTQGDVEIDWFWIPETHEAWKIMDDIYAYCRPVPGQHRDLDNIWVAKLPYYGACVDNLNSPITSPMERIKAFQYYYDIVLYRIELLMASDKGKILAANINAIPKSQGIDTNKFLYFMEANKIAFLNPKEEKMKGQGGDGSVANMVKEIDLSLVSQISNYIQIAEYIDKMCGAALGVTKQMEGAIGPTEAVSNTRQSLIQSSYITRPYFELHNQVKKNVLQALIETAKVAYTENPPEALSYVLDDMTTKMLSIDTHLLEQSTYGIFVSNSAKSEEARQAIINLSQAALQNQQATLTDIAKIINSSSVAEAIELLEVAQKQQQEQMQQMQAQKQQADQQLQKQQQDFLKEQWGHEKDMLLTKIKEQGKIDLQKATISAMGYDLNKDEDADTIPDTLEVYRAGAEADIQRQKVETEAHSQQLEEQKFNYQKEKDRADRAQKEREIKAKSSAKTEKSK
jgi:hypothetical protein